MVNNIKTFDERIKELVALGKEQGYLTYEQLAKKTLDLDLDSNALDELYNVLTENQIEVRAEDEEEGGTRCSKCYYLRLERTAMIAKDKNFDYFTTTLSISPYKNSDWINEIGLKLEKEVVGVYISGHPLDNYLDKYKTFNLTSDQFVADEEEFESVEEDDSEKEYSNLTDGMTVTCGGIVTEVKKLLTKKGNKEMAFLKIEDF